MLKNNEFFILSIAVLSLEIIRGFTHFNITICYSKYFIISLNFSTINISKCLTLKKIVKPMISIKIM